MKKLLALLAALCLVVSVAPRAAAATAETVEQTIRAMGIITGDQNGNLNLDDNVTRAQFAKMMVAASTLRDSIGAVGTGSLFGDVGAAHWASEYIRAAVQAGWLVGYVDGSFRPDGGIKTEEAATAILRMLGYTQADLTGVYPSPQMAKYYALGLSQSVSAQQGQAMTRRDCMYLFYNLMMAKTSVGSVYASTIGYSVTAAGEINYSSLVESRLKGPFVAQSAELSDIVPFPLANAEVYRAGALTSSRTIELYDIVYYHEELRTVWVYTSRVTGLYTSASPSAESPSAVTVGGAVYQVSSTTAAFKLSTMGQYSIGDTVTLLLGRTGEVVEVLALELSNAVYYGVAAGSSKASYAPPSGGTQSRDVSAIFCTDGAVREFPRESDSFTPGTAVRVVVENGRISMERASSGPLSGNVGETTSGIGALKFAPNVQIIDSNREGGAAELLSSRLAGYSLKAADIRFYALNYAGEISHLILNDVTGDLYEYGLVTSAVETETAVTDEKYTYSAVYSYIIDGLPGVYSADTFMYITEGAYKITRNGAALARVDALAGYNVTSLTQSGAQAEGRRLEFAQGLQVYHYKNGSYSLSSLDEVGNLGEYSLTCYVDSHSAGGRVRIIVAK